VRRHPATVRRIHLPCRGSVPSWPSGPCRRGRRRHGLRAGLAVVCCSASGLGRCLRTFRHPRCPPAAAAFRRGQVLGARIWAPSTGAGRCLPSVPSFGLWGLASATSWRHSGWGSASPLPTPSLAGVGRGFVGSSSGAARSVWGCRGRFTLFAPWLVLRCSGDGVEAKAIARLRADDGDALGRRFPFWRHHLRGPFPSVLPR